MEGHAEKCVERYCELARKDVSPLQEVASPCKDDHQIPPEGQEQIREFTVVCAQIVMKCLYVARIGRPHL